MVSEVKNFSAIEFSPVIVKSYTAASRVSLLPFDIILADPSATSIIVSIIKIDATLTEIYLFAMFS